MTIAVDLGRKATKQTKQKNSILGGFSQIKPKSMYNLYSNTDGLLLLICLQKSFDMLDLNGNTGAALPFVEIPYH